MKIVNTQYQEKDGWKLKIKEVKEIKDINQVRKEVMILIKELHVKGVKFINEFDKKRLNA